jgi:hypothetical protein
MSHNGYSNYETWSIVVMLSNDPIHYANFRGTTGKYIERAMWRLKEHNEFLVDLSLGEVNFEEVSQALKGDL